MGIPKLLKDLNIIRNIPGMSPGSDAGLTPEQFKAKFDEAALTIQEWINVTLIPHIDSVLSSGSVFGVNFKLPDENGNVTITADDINVGDKTISDKIAEMDETAASPVNTEKLADNSVTSQKIANNSVSNVYTATVGTTWSGSAAPYSQDVLVSGVTANDIPVIDMVASGTFATAEAQEEAWANVYRAVTGENKITFYAKDKTTTNVPVQIRCIRK